MEKNFKKLLGNRVYLLAPPKESEDSKIIVDQNTKEALKLELIKKMKRLTVYAVGEGINNPDLTEGSEVMVDPEALARRTLVVPLEDDFEVLMISYFDIVHIWK